MMAKKNRVIFFGTDDLSIHTLNVILDLNVELLAVVTKPDKIFSNKIIIPPIKKICIEKKIHIFQPNKVINIKQDLIKLNPDLIITCSYGKIIPKVILDIPQYECINIHPSNLPLYRGASPMQFSILNRDQKTGLTIMYMSEGLDNGDIILQKDVIINDRETFYSLKEKMKAIITELLRENISSFFSHSLKRTQQNELKATHTTLIDSTMERIKWNLDAWEIDAKIRAFYDKPIAYTVYNGQRIKIYSTLLINNSTNKVPGTIIEVSKEGISVACLNGVLKITKLQLPSKKPVEFSQLFNGNHKFKIDTLFV